MEGNADTVVDPFLTTIGSPNYGYRSTHKDIEGHAFVLSDDPALRADWGKVGTIPDTIVTPTHSSLLGDIGMSAFVRSG
jgi:hypothetical protein